MTDYLSNYKDHEQINNQSSQQIPLTDEQQQLFYSDPSQPNKLLPFSGMVLPSAEWAFFDTNQVQSEKEKRPNGKKKKLAMDGYWPHPLVGRETDEEIFPSGKEKLKDLGFYTADWWEASGHLIYLPSGGLETAAKVNEKLYDNENSIFTPQGLNVNFSSAGDPDERVITDFTLFNPQIYHDNLVGGSLTQPPNNQYPAAAIRLPFVSDPIVTTGGLNVYNQYGGFDAEFKG